MAVNLEDLTIQELMNLAADAAATAQQKAQAEQLSELEEEEARKERIGTAVARLTNLLGPEGSPPYVPGGQTPPSIRGLLAYPPEIMAQNSGIALQMLFQGLEELTITTRDIAGILGSV